MVSNDDLKYKIYQMTVSMTVSMTVTVPIMTVTVPIMTVTVSILLVVGKIRKKPQCATHASETDTWPHSKIYH